jgi:TrmH family RNA methyltransferase
MGELSTIRSTSNPKWKRVGAVLAGKDREHMVLEGDRLVEDAVSAGVALDAVFVEESRESLAQEWLDRGLPVFTVERKLVEKASGLVTPPGAIAVAARPREPGLSELQALATAPRALVLVAAGVSDPGNLGALARSAEAAGATALVALEGCASPWNAKSLRGSMGSLLRVPVVEGESPAEVARVLAHAGARQLRAETRGGASFADLDWSGPIALWIASETGRHPEVAASFESVSVPMRGEAESLNVAVAASILLFAAGRWREGAE